MAVFNPCDQYCATYDADRIMVFVIHAWLVNIGHGDLYCGINCLLDFITLEA